MAKIFTELPPVLQEFIAHQKMFFVATAAPTGRINLSPKGMDSIRVLGPNRVMWLNVTGSGNETAAHIKMDDRMTLMFMSFDEKPLILRLYGTAKCYHQRDAEWEQHIGLFPAQPGSRQLYDVHVETAQTSCGWGVPVMDFVGTREKLDSWTNAKSPEELKAYQLQKNSHSIDGFPTGLVE